jgi:putative redox protein
MFGKQIYKTRGIFEKKAVMKIQLKRKNKAYHFEAENEDGATLQLDGTPSIGGENKGFRPMQLLLAGMGGCSAIDIGIILNKQKQVIEDFRIEIDAERESGKEPAVWENAHLIFYLKGAIDPDKAKRAVDLSMEKYCSVAETLRRAGAKITWEVKLNT